MKFLLVVFSTLFALSTLAFDAAKYFEKTCAQCHSIGGGDGPGKGPDLAGVSKRRELDWIVKFIQYPDGMIEGDEEEEGYEKPDPIAVKLYELYRPTMMVAQEDITKDQVVAILKYIDSKKKEPKGKILKLNDPIKK